MDNLMYGNSSDYHLDVSLILANLTMLLPRFLMSSRQVTDANILGRV